MTGGISVFFALSVSELGRVRALELELQLVCDEGDELGVRGLALGVGHGVPEKPLQGVQIPRSQATSMACRMARSTREGVVWNVFVTWGYNTFVMALMTSISPTAMMMASRRYW